jgi:hypothetical protein
VLPWRIPQPSKHCAYVRRSSNPCQQGQHTVNFHPPCHALYFRPLSLRTRRISHCRQTKSASHPCLFLDVPDTTQIRKKHAMFSQSVADSEPANEHCRHCHVRKAHVSSPARQSRFCRRSQPRHPLYQPYRVHEEGPIVFFESWWWLALYACVCMT